MRIVLFNYICIITKPNVNGPTLFLFIFKLLLVNKTAISLDVAQDIVIIALPWKEYAFQLLHRIAPEPATVEDSSILPLSGRAVSTIHLLSHHLSNKQLYLSEHLRIVH